MTASEMNKEIGKRIKACRKEKKMTQKDLASMIGCADITLSEYERGKYLPKTEIRVKIANALDVPYASLFVINSSSPENLGIDMEALKRGDVEAALNGKSADLVGTFYDENGNPKNELEHFGPVPAVDETVLDASDLTDSERKELKNYKEYLKYRRYNPPV